MALAIQSSTVPLAAQLRALKRDIFTALYQAGGGHYGGCLSVLDILLVLYRTRLKLEPQNPQHPQRDRLILSKGHAAVAQYAILRQLGFFQHDIAQYAQFDSPLEGHPDMHTVAGIDFSSGSLGQGLSVGLGMALSLSSQVWVILGDGECQEGQVWEAAMLAKQLGLGNINVVIDCNKQQEWGWQDANGQASSPIVDIRDKWQSFGWQVFECDGHDHQQLADSLLLCEQATQPCVVIANTVKGHGVDWFLADPVRFHCATLSESEHLRLMRALDE